MSHEGSVTLTPRLLPTWSAASLGRWHMTENCVSFPETHLLGHLLDHPRQEVLLCLPGKGPAEGNHVIKTERGIEMQRSQTRISPSLSRREGQGTGTTEKRARFPCRSPGWGGPRSWFPSDRDHLHSPNTQSRTCVIIEIPKNIPNFITRTEELRTQPEDKAPQGAPLKGSTEKVDGSAI